MFPVLLAALALSAARAAIDRRAVVARHALRTAVSDATLLSPLDVYTIGNGDFAINVDATGLQTFNDTYATAAPSLLDLNTLASWGWHSNPTFFPKTSDPAAYLRAMNWSYLETAVSATANRTVPYLVGSNMTSTYGGWTARNPHRAGLGQLALRAVRAGAALGDDPAELVATTVVNLTSELDTWAGGVTAAFMLLAPGGAASAFAVTVATAVHPDVDLVSTRVTCARTAGAGDCPTALRLALPYSMASSPSANTWGYADAHTSAVVVNTSAPGATRVSILHTADDLATTVDCEWDDARWTFVRTDVPHAFALVPPPGAAAAVELSCVWAPAGLRYPIGTASSAFVRAKVAATRALLGGVARFPFYADVEAAQAAMFNVFWAGGSFVELAAKGAPDALELERRVVLSRYLTRVNSAGASPPQETGLISNSWAGKFHLEMRFWHHAHWTLWGNSDLMARSWGFYVDLLPNATSLASHQGYAGARWLKMLGLANPLLDGVGGAAAIDVPWIGHDAPPPNISGSLLLWDTANTINPVLVWQQPHVVWLANAQRLAANASGGDAAARAVVAELAQLVAATADFMASFAFFNATTGFYELGGPILGGEEYGHGSAPMYYQTIKPVFETVYFAAMLDVANEWRELQGLPRDARYDAVAAGLGGLTLDPAEDPPAYSFNFNAACCYVNRSACPPGRFGGRDSCSMQSGHPMPAGILGWVDGLRFGNRYGVDAAVANATVRAIVERWGWASGGAWGWDMPLVAMAQIRQQWTPEASVATLLMNVSRNEYIRVGYNNFGTFLYLPGNGGTLLTVGMMAAGTSTSPRCYFPVAWGAACEGFAAAFQ